MKIITLTFNPALDKSIAVPELVPEKKLRATDAKTEPGGGGVNVSRALHKLGVESEAVYLSGGYTGKEFDKLLAAEGVKTAPQPIAGETRENFVVVDASANKQYRFGMQGPDVSDDECRRAMEYVRGQSGMDYIVMSGSLPPGASPSLLGELAKLAREKNARLVVDTSGEALKAAVGEGVFLIKPNLGELAGLYGREKLNRDEILKAAREIIGKGGCELMAISMGADGAILVSATEEFTVKPPKVPTRSTVGAGDSMVAGMLAALSRNWSLPDVIRYGVAAGAAATMNAGTELCKKEDTDRLFAELKQQ